MGRAAAWLALATLVMTYPIGVFPWSLGPFGEPDAKESAWALSWVSHQLTTDPLRVFDAHQFHPLQKTLSLSEQHLLAGLLALPLLHVTNDLVLTYNLLLLFALFASALSMYLLVVSLTASQPAAILAGLFFAFTPYRLTHLSPIPLQLDAFLPLALACVHRFVATGDRRWIGRLLVCLVAEGLSASHLAVASLVALGAAALTLSPSAPRPAYRLGLLAAAAALAVVLVVPLWQPYLRTCRSLHADGQTTDVVSAEPGSYLTSSSFVYRALRWWNHGLPGTKALFPGLTVLVLATGGWLMLAMRKGGFPRPWARASCYALVLLAGVSLTLGPHTSAFAFFKKGLCCLRGLADLSRFSVLTSLALSVLSGHGLSWILRRVRRARALALGIAVAYAAESWVFPAGLQPLRDRAPEVYLWLAAAAPAGAIVELPYHPRDEGYLLGARHHGFRPSLNGASAWVPPSHRLLARLLEPFPSSEALSVLQQLNVRYIVIHADGYDPHRLVRLLNELARYRSHLLPLRDFGRQLVYEVIVPGEEEEGKARRTEVALSARGEPPVLFDSDKRAPWQASTTVADVEVELSPPAVVSGLRFHYGPNPLSPAVELEVLAPDESGEWKRLWEAPPQWPALSQLVLGLIEEPEDGRQTAHFDPVRTGRLLLHLRGLEGPVAISEIEVLAPPGPN